MYKFTDIQYTLLTDLVDSIAIPQNHKSNVFWCPKVITKHGKKREGFILYIYGGHILEVYAKKNGLGVCIFSDKYCQHFSTESRGRKIRQEFCDMNEQNHKGIEVLKNGGEDIWEEICDACFKWATKSDNPEYERMRQTRICNDAMVNDKFCVFTMEEKIFVDDKQPEVDMVAIRCENEKTIISYIEYKCTEAAITGKCSINKHYGDMAKISLNDVNIARMLDLYYLKQKMLGKTIECVDINTCKQEMIFLISNVQEDKLEELKTGQYMSSETLYKELMKTLRRTDFRDGDVKVLFLEDVDVKGNDKYVLDVEKTMTVSEAMERVKTK